VLFNSVFCVNGVIFLEDLQRILTESDTGARSSNITRKQERKLIVPHTHTRRKMKEIKCQGIFCNVGLLKINKEECVYVIVDVDVNFVSSRCSPGSTESLYRAVRYFGVLFYCTTKISFVCRKWTRLPCCIFRLRMILNHCFILKWKNSHHTEASVISYTVAIYAAPILTLQNPSGNCMYHSFILSLALNSPG
jgi:hypothetical protein